MVKFKIVADKTCDLHKFQLYSQSVSPAAAAFILSVAKNGAGRPATPLAKRLAPLLPRSV